jgi:threonylcarbamoyladenosine tRNA methylthiotransferase MtaB
MVFGADIIAGFPTETDEMFENTRRIVEDCDLTFLHIFPYSPREGTPAARMPQVDKKIRKERAAILRALGDTQLMKHMTAQVGREHLVLVEKNHKARTPHFAEVKLDREVKAGEIVKVKITAVEDMVMQGTVMHEVQA